MENWLTIGYHRYRPCNNANYLIPKGFCTFTDRVFISPSVPTDNFDLPMENWFTIGTDRWTIPYALAIMLTTSFTKGFCTFTDRVFISPSVPTDNFDLPMENWFTIGTDRTDGQGFWGLPYALAIMLIPIHERISAHLPIVYLGFTHPYRRTTSIYRWRIGLPSVPTVPMDKVFGGYLMPLQ